MVRRQIARFPGNAVLGRLTMVYLSVRWAPWRQRQIGKDANAREIATARGGLTDPLG